MSTKVSDPFRGLPPLRGRRGGAQWTTVALTAFVVTAVLAAPAGAVGTPSDRTPVDLATPVNLANGTANSSAVVRAGDARIEVLSPTLLRLEYSPTASFENLPTVNAVDRRFAVPPYRTSVTGGWLTVRTAKVTLRYRVGSGPFTTHNTSVKYSLDGRTSTVHPTWEWECTFAQVCQAGAASLAGKATLSQTTPGYESTAGYVGNVLVAGDGATWSVLGAPAGHATLTVRLAAVSLLQSVDHDVQVVVNGAVAGTVTAPTPQGLVSPWVSVSTPVRLQAGTDSVGVRCAAGDGCEVNVDSISVSRAGTPAPVRPDTGPLGGWIRGFDTATYNTTPECTPGQTAATCVAGLQPLNEDGLLDRAGWRLLDDTRSAQWSSSGWVDPRPAHGDVEDGYLFAYGRDYTGALRTLERLTGPAPLLPRTIFGVWYSDYTPYSAADIENTVYPAFEANHVPLNTLSLDTDWKAPNDWDGWEWNPTLFPDPSGFLEWARQRGINVTLNIHSSIATNDPRLATAETVAGHTLASATCTSVGPCKVWDWSTVAQAESNFSLQQVLSDHGVSFYWLDWCCDSSTVSAAGVTPDSWIDHLYFQDLVNSGQRGFVLGRIGGSEESPEEVFPAGPWSDHTSAIAFTGDAWGTWNTLAREAELTPDEATIGEPYVSDDIGSFLGPPPSQSGTDPPDLYDRWVQLGTFQPILRLHSNNETRLPWEYPEPVQGITESFLRLRESLVPYSYSVAAAASTTGLPMAAPLWLADPTQPDAYDHPTEYRYGPDVLVAPVTSPGTPAAVTVWFPPGRWVDWFTGATFTGPKTVTVSEPLDRMAVFVAAGGIVPEATPAVATGPKDALALHVYPGAAGSFALYNDAGTGLGSAKGQRTVTTVTTRSKTESGGTPAATTVTVGPARGSFPGAPRSTDDSVVVADLSAPTRVTVDGRVLPHRAAGASKGWSYDASIGTLTVTPGPTRAASGFTITETGGAPLSASEPTPAVTTPAQS